MVWPLPTFFQAKETLKDLRSALGSRGQPVAALKRATLFVAGQEPKGEGETAFCPGLGLAKKLIIGVFGIACVYGERRRQQLVVSA